MHIIVAGIMAATISAADGDARFDVGIRVGLGLATAQYVTYRLDGPPDTPRLDRVAPVWVEAGYRLTPALLVGAYFQYGFGRVDPSAARPPLFCPTADSCSTTGHTVRAGGEVQYRIATAAPLAPWLGFGAGYVSHSVTITTRESSAVTTTGSGGVILAPLSPVRISGTTTSLDVNLQAGADARLGSRATLGPYVSVFSGESAGIEAGIRGRFSL